MSAVIQDSFVVAAKTWKPVALLVYGEAARRANRCLLADQLGHPVGARLLLLAPRPAPQHHLAPLCAVHEVLHTARGLAFDPAPPADPADELAVVHRQPAEGRRRNSVPFAKTPRSRRSTSFGLPLRT